MEIAIVEEDDPGLGIPCLGHPGWREDWPWLVQGITASGPDRGWDLGLFGAEPTGSVQARWEELGAAQNTEFAWEWPSLRAIFERFGSFCEHGAVSR